MQPGHGTPPRCTKALPLKYAISLPRELDAAPCVAVMRGPELTAACCALLVLMEAMPGEFDCTLPWELDGATETAEVVEPELIAAVKLATRCLAALQAFHIIEVELNFLACNTSCLCN